MTRSLEHPLITFAIFAYNQERFIAEAVQGALGQTYSPLEIILSDDCSSDNTYTIIQETIANYDGAHRVIARRNERNLGLGQHVNVVMELAKGELTVAAAGDDISLPHRTERLWQEYVAAERNAYSLFSNEYLIDENGTSRALGRQRPPNSERLTLNWFINHQASVTGSSQAWRRDVFDLFGPLNEHVVSEDVVIPFRALLLGSIRYIHEPLVLRRYTGDNLSMGSFNRWNPNITTRDFCDREIRHARNFEAVYRTWQMDIEKFKKIQPKQQHELDSMVSVIEHKLSRVQSEVRFWQASNSVKSKLLFQDFVCKGFRSTAARLFLSWIFPQVFLRWRHIISTNQREALLDTQSTRLK